MATATAEAPSQRPVEPGAVVPPDGDPATEQPVDVPGAVGERRPEHPPGRTEQAGLGDGAEQPGRRRAVVHVRRQPVDQPHLPERRGEADDEQHPGGRGEAEQHPDQAGVHCSTRTSSGSRPIRSISR